MVAAIADRTGVSKADVDRVLTGFQDIVSQEVAKGDQKVSIPGFLSFEQTTRSARTGRNPQTGEPIQVPASKAVKVSAGSKLKAIAKGDEKPPT
ncbi:MAG: HU family DNA-binding protein [Acidimicrobiia bacterium]|nr:HU family DNA-binding protein [Acidimicrobiia bacterium]